MITLKQMLAGKNRPLAVVTPTDSIFHALSLMAMHDVGGLLVLDGEDLVGIFTERDYARKLILHGKSSKETLVSEIMSDKVAYVTLSGDPAADIATIASHYAGRSGKRPELASPVRWLE